MNAYTNISSATDDEISLEDLPLPTQHVENDASVEEATATEMSMPVEPTSADPDAVTEPDQPVEAITPTETSDAPDVEEQSSVVPVAPTIPSQTMTPAAQSMPDGYALFADGVYALPDDETDAPVFVCTPLRVDATFADSSGRGWGRLVSVKSADDRWHEIPITNADLQGKPAVVLARLVDHGLDLAPGKKSKDLLLDLLKAWKPDQHLLTVSRMGWSDETHTSFVLGSRLVGSAQVLPLAPATGIGAGLVETGEVGAWRANIATRCSGNPLMIVAVSLAFSGPLLARLGVHGGGLHFRGASSSGKTTLLNIAASVWGDRRLITPWRATSNGLEAIASTMNDMLLPLDEIAEIQPRVLHEAIYMLANGTGKARMTKEVTLADQARWRLALISSGEISIEEKLKEARLDAMAGHEMRLIDIEADSRTYGAFDNLHGVANAAAFADAMQRFARKYHGAAGRAYVERLISNKAQLTEDKLQGWVRTLVSQWTSKIPAQVDGQTSRAAMRFAVIGLAGKIATVLGLTGWTRDEAVDAAELMFLDWYDRRYGAKRDAADAFVSTLQQFLSTKLTSLPKVDDAAVAGVDPIGWCDASRVYLPQMTWSQLFPGADGQKAATALRDMQMLVSGEDGRLTRKAPRAIPGRPRLYTVIIDRVTVYKVA
ncbi:Uncharcterized protein, DUF927 family [Gemmobacter megaterium]|uniref:Uncharcterized protein, DUF927 family n=1 Tax=Gemmobacter megaterium TaxID=1086013 RepID=A0A1N7QPE9_9RHOB|nr:DUF927 domain-containing protein [Gemmobacter megaterium]SIT24644.1 Uncharcterized protein, DUF927 family [Gemmobacter megaterium]